MKLSVPFLILIGLTSLAQARESTKPLVEIDKASAGMGLKSLNEAITLLAKRRVEVVRQQAESFLREGVINGTLPVKIGQQFANKEEEEKIVAEVGYTKFDVYNDGGVYLGYLYYQPFPYHELLTANSEFIKIDLPVQDGKIGKDGIFKIEEFRARWSEGKSHRKDGFEIQGDGVEPTSYYVRWLKPNNG